MDKVSSLKNKTLKQTGKMAKNTGQVREKLGNFVTPEPWHSIKPVNQVSMDPSVLRVP